MKKISARKLPVDHGNGTAESSERIRTRAYELFEQRGREDGHDLEDWLAAENEIHDGASRAAA